MERDRVRQIAYILLFVTIVLAYVLTLAKAPPGSYIILVLPGLIATVLFAITESPDSFPNDY